VKNDKIFWKIYFLSDCWKDAKNPSLVRPHGRFGDYQCDSSVDLVASVLQFMKAKMGDRVDFIIWTGYDDLHKFSTSHFDVKLHWGQVFKIFFVVCFQFGWNHKALLT
jgi:hypothetical protein